MRRIAFLALVVFVMFSVSAVAAPVEVSMWAPGDPVADPTTESGLVTQQVEDFNAMQDEVKVNLVVGPIDQWTAFVNSGALAGDLPDILYLDGPTIANFAWSGYLMDLAPYVPQEMYDDLLPSILQQGYYNDGLYAIGAFDSGLAIWGNKSYLEQAGVRIPTSVEDAWDRAEFEEALAALTALDGVEYAMDMKMNYGQGEWFTYGFSPILQSMGGDLIDRSTYLSADGVLNGPESVAAMEMFQSWFTNGYVEHAPAGDTDFEEGRAALSWVGHWMYSRHKEALGDDLILLPMPKLGESAATGTGSWAWSLTSNAQNPEAAFAYIEYVTSPEQIIRMTNINGAVPARLSALDMSDLYREDGELRVFADQLISIGVERPVTPAYPTITSAFAEAVNNIAAGANVKRELDRAVNTIDLDIEDHDGYPMLW